MLFALTETELEGYITQGNCNVSKMWISLEQFWQEARNYSRGKPVNIPLVGSGVTGIRLSANRILELNLRFNVPQKASFPHLETYSPQ